MRKNIKYKEGDLFLIELDNNKSFFGLIIRRQGRTKILAGYFWKMDFALSKEVILKKEDSVLFAKFSGLGFEIGNWKIMHEYYKWKKEDWPIPVLKKYDQLRKCYYAVTYCDNDLLNEDVKKITDKDATHLFKDGLHGYISLENELSKFC
jgi:hypothetical protein